MRRFIEHVFLLSGWVALRRMVLIGVALPFFLLLFGLSGSGSAHWDRVREYMLATYIRETAVVAAGSVAAAAVLGVVLAWCVGLHRFPGRKIFESLLLLPLAVPPFIAAYAYDGLLGYTGFVQTTLRNRFGLDVNAYGFSAPPMLYAIFVFSITLYPYIYLLSRAYLHSHSASLLENAALLGGGKARIFFRIVLPLLWPSALAGGTLVCLEVLNDFGVVSHFGIHTFTTAIFAAWFGMGETGAAVRLALMLLAAVLAVLAVVKMAQNRGRYRPASSREKGYSPRKLEGIEAAAAICLCLGASLVCFVIPVAQMIAWAAMAWEGVNAELLLLAWQSLYTAGLATILIMSLALASGVANHAYPGRLSRLAAQVSGMGYAIPAAVLSIGAVMLFALLDRLSPLRFQPPLGMTLGLLVYAYAVRFFSVGFQAVDNGYLKMGRIRSEASRVLGRGVTMTFFLVDLPMLGKAAGVGFVLVFVDIIKELPLALTLRPFNFDTLGTKVHEFANNEAIPETALPSLVIIGISAALVLFMRLWERKEQS